MGCGKSATCPFCNQYDPGVSAATCGITCHATSTSVTDKYCMETCNGSPPDCPMDLCQCNNKIQVSASDCGHNSSYMHFTSFKINQTNIVLGKGFTVFASLPKPAEITMSTVYETRAVFSLTGLPFSSHESDLVLTRGGLSTTVQASSYNPPMVLASVGYDAVNSTDLGISITLPTRIVYPDFIIKARRNDGTELFCARVNTTTANAVSTEVLGSAILV